MPENKPAEDIDVTKEWRATQGQKSSATRLRLFAAIAWVIAIGTEIAGVVMLRQHKFDHGNLPLLIGLLVVIAIFAIAGSLLWKAANKQDPASKADPERFFFQNQLGAIGVASHDAHSSVTEEPYTRQDLTLSYRRPAAQWVEALPVGNGRLGAMVFGGVGVSAAQEPRFTFGWRDEFVGVANRHTVIGSKALGAI